jgi:hypothetical protein
MDRRGPAVTEADVAAFETRLGRKLPDDYRDFLLQVNGGRPDDEHCEFSVGIVNRLFSLHDEEDEARNLEVRAERVRSELAPELLFIGHDDGGGRILLVVDGPHLGEVWFQVHEGRLPESNPRATWDHRRDFRKLADTFAQFMNSLTPLT